MSSALRELGLMGWAAVNAARETTRMDTSGLCRGTNKVLRLWEAFLEEGTPRFSLGFKEITLEAREGWIGEVSTGLDIVEIKVERNGQIRKRSSDMEGESS